MAAANTTRNQGKPGDFYLPSEQADQGETLCIQARALTDCISATAHSNAPVPDGTLSNACWLLRDLLDQIGGIIELRQPAIEAETA